jgi:hypothetical protein
MNWTDFILGGMTVLLVGVFVSIGMEEREEPEEQPETSNNVIVSDFSRKLHQLSCQTCRKIKNHREIEPRVFECTKCKRRTNLNVG